MTSVMPTLILGSQSRWRAKVLADAGFVFTQVSPDIDEKAIRDPRPDVLPLLIARAKSAALRSRLPPFGILVTSDQVAVCDGEIREKPRDVDEARRLLRSYAGHCAGVVNALVVVDLATGRSAEGIQRSTVWYRPTLARDIEALAASEEIRSCAGAFRTEDPMMRRHQYEADGQPDAFCGMPLDLLLRLLAEVSL